jgi:chlorobactene glucosyltransferase
MGPFRSLLSDPNPWRTLSVDLFLLSIPWIAVSAYLGFFFRNPRKLPAASGEGGEGLAFVSVIVPARNEEENIGRCVESLMASDYPGFEVLVVDDRSQDRTREIVREIAEQRRPSGAEGNEDSVGESGSPVTLVLGEPLPEGWFGKPWACWQGAKEAKGDLLLFTDADTVHSPDLLKRVVVALEEDQADALTVIGRQVMVSFWEQLIQPQFFMLLAGRYPRTDKPRKARHWRHAIANGQYLVFRRGVYKSMGGHEAVAHEVVEDLRLAQILVRGGWTLSVRQADGLRTRMYRSLSGLVEGWSKNVATAALQTTPGWMLPIILPLSFLVGVLLWVLPPSVLAFSLFTGARGLILAWSATATGLGLFLWTQASRRMKGNPLMGFLFPVGALFGLYIFTRSWLRGARIHWKGRDYQRATDGPDRFPSSGADP